MTELPGMLPQRLPVKARFGQEQTASLADRASAGSNSATGLDGEGFDARSSDRSQVVLADGKAFHLALQNPGKANEHLTDAPLQKPHSFRDDLAHVWRLIDQNENVDHLRLRPLAVGSLDASEETFADSEAESSAIRFEDDTPTLSTMSIRSAASDDTLVGVSGDDVEMLKTVEISSENNASVVTERVDLREEDIQQIAADRAVFEHLREEAVVVNSEPPGIGSPLSVDRAANLPESAVAWGPGGRAASEFAGYDRGLALAQMVASRAAPGSAGSKASEMLGRPGGSAIPTSETVSPSQTPAEAVAMSVRGPSGQAQRPFYAGLGSLIQNLEAAAPRFENVKQGQDGASAIVRLTAGEADGKNRSTISSLASIIVDQLKPVDNLSAALPRSGAGTASAPANQTAAVSGPQEFASSAPSGGTRSLEVQLVPRTLGVVQLNMVHSENGLRIEVLVQRSEALQFLQSQGGSLSEALSRAGVMIEEITITSAAGRDLGNAGQTQSEQNSGRNAQSEFHEDAAAGHQSQDQGLEKQHQDASRDLDNTSSGNAERASSDELQPARSSRSNEENSGLQEGISGRRAIYY